VFRGASSFREVQMEDLIETDVRMDTRKLYTYEAFTPGSRR
jgi:hypothetical protein